MTHTDTPTVDTSADTIAALLHDLYHSNMACALTHQAAQVIEALRADFGPIKGLTDEDHANIIAHLSPELEPRGPLPNANSLMMAIVYLRNEIARLTAERDAALAGAVEVRPLAEPMRFSAAIHWRGHDDAWLVFAAQKDGEWVRWADYEIIIASIQPDTEALEMAEAAAFSAGFEAGQRGEREACAVLIETRDGSIPYRQEIAAAIRKRGESKG